MIRLKPHLEITPRACPNCGSELIAANWLIIGMRNLAELICSTCKREFYQDLPAGQGLYTPLLLDKKSGAVFDEENVGWFADWLRDSHKNRTKEPVKFEARKFLPVKEKVVLLNCLDVLYGHSLLKLLNAQHYIDREPDLSLIVILPVFLEWMLPEGAAEAWIVDLPLSRGTEWNDWLAGEIRERIESFQEVYLSPAFSHPHSSTFDIKRFTGVQPFPFENFAVNRESPVVTFIWREDRLWETENNAARSKFERVKMRLRISQTQPGVQTSKVIEFAESLRETFPKLDFAVAGIGEARGLPAWIADLRLAKLNEKAERAWCERYARSHIVVGVHGSNMLLPSAHAGAVIELIGQDRWGNYLQDILLRGSDAREMLFRYRFVPHSTAPADLAQLAASVLRYGDFRRLMSQRFCTHENKAAGQN